MIKIPYGLADFYRIIRDRYLYLDRTAYIRVIEEMGEDALLLIRPRRFGKSLWLQTLRCYYDVGLAGEFDELFGRLAIGRDPTPLHNRYFVLQWNFSRVNAGGSVDQIGSALASHVNNTIANLLSSYRDLLTHPVAIEPDPGNTLRNLLTAVRQTPYRLYLLIHLPPAAVQRPVRLHPGRAGGRRRADGARRGAVAGEGRGGPRGDAHLVRRRR